jgi:hypothetical protein
MRHLAVGVRGASGSDAGSAEEIRTPGLDRLLWLFLRLLMSKNALDRFLTTMSSEEINARLEQLKKDLAGAQQAAAEDAGDDESYGRCRTASPWRSCVSTTTSARRRTRSSSRSNWIGWRARFRRSRDGRQSARTLT